MARKSKGRSSRRRVERKRPVSSAGLPSPRRRHGQAQAVPSRRRIRRVHRATGRSRRTEVAGLTRDEVPAKRRHRRDPVRSSLQPAKPSRLPTSVLRRRNYPENASQKKTTRSVCTRKKQTRRAVIIANGYGGINNVRNYRRHETCR